MKLEVQCPECGGSGQVPVGEHHVTREMALDAGCPEMEGTFYEVEYDRCALCGGSGLVESDEDPIDVPAEEFEVDDEYSEPDPEG